jgi:hypothetical protein
MLFIFFLICLCLSADSRFTKTDFSKSVVKDGLKLLLYSKYPKDLNNKTNIYNECLEFVNEMKQYRNSIDEYKEHIKSYCENVFGNAEKATLQNVCEYIIDVIIDDIKNDFLPEYLNENLCNLFK